jgi:hypothetical protein
MLLSRIRNFKLRQIWVEGRSTEIHPRTLIPRICFLRDGHFIRLHVLFKCAGIETP